MRAHVLQHVPYEGIGSIAGWLEEHHATVTWTRFHQGEFPASPGEPDLLVIMGGPMSVHDEADFPWLATEKQFIGQALDAGIPTLGICLGAQLIAEVLGATVGASPHPEIGWFPIRGVPPARPPDSFRIPEELIVFHWHGESFGIPAGACHLASSPGCPNQAFQHGSSTIGLQFHLETTLASARDIMEHNDPRVPSTYIQSDDMILAAPETHYQGANQLMRAVLDYLTNK